MNSLESHALRLIGENTSSPDVFSDTASGMSPIRDSINDALQELCMLTGSYRRSYLLPLYADRQFYRMSFERDHFGWVVECWDRNRRRRLTQTDLIKLTHDDPWWMQRTGSPIEYMQIGPDILGLYYKPSANGTVLELSCVCIPKPYSSDTDPVKVREEFQRAAVYSAVCEFYASRGDAKRATEYFDRYLETAGLMGMKPEAQERPWQMGGNKWTSRK